MNQLPEKGNCLQKLRKLHPFCSATVNLVIAVTLAVAAIVLLRPFFFEILELKLYDLKFRVRGVQTPGPEVVIIAIDDASLKKLGRWPWSREVMADLVTRLKEAGPRVIALDIIFAEREEKAAIKIIQKLCREVALTGEATPNILKILENEDSRASVDQQLAQVIGQGPPVILGFFFRDIKSKSALKDEDFMGESAPKGSTYNLVRWLSAKPTAMPIMGAGGIETNLPEITDAAAGTGYFNMVPDRDGTIRWLPQTIFYGSDMFAPLSSVTVQCYLGNPPLSLALSHMGVEETRLGRQILPVDQFGRLLINYLGPEGRFPHYSAVAVMEGKVPGEALKDKIVLVGATAVGIFDLRVTPFSAVCPGIEVQATIMDNFLRNQFVRTARNPNILVLAIILSFGLLLGGVLPRLSAVWSFIFTSLLIQGYIVTNYLIFSHWRWQLELFYPLLVIGAIYLGITLQRFLAEEKERLRVKKAFQSYVAPEVVNEILKHPENLRLGGERREMSVLFSDIRGFTKLSEALEPEVLVNLLHNFLDPMSDIIVSYGGTIDKYIGDAIMALFGAPLQRPDHASLACRTAWMMMVKLKQLNQEWQTQGYPSIQIGIGINSGPMAVGNMGSKRLFNYTAVGDNVNLASRLESLNKYYGTEILIGESTAQVLDGDFVLREVDLVKVKGKTKPSILFELLGEGPIDPQLAQFLKAYKEARALLKERQFGASFAAFAKALKFRPGDIPTRNYLELAEKYQKDPPGPEWQPVRVMQQK